MDTHELTAREIDVLKLVADDLSTKEISEQLDIEDRTVRKHIESLKTKLHVKGLAGLGMAAARFRIV